MMRSLKTTPTVRIGDDTAAAINELGGTFDSVDDVLKRLVEQAGHEELLEQDSTESDEEASKTSAKERKQQFIEEVRSLRKVNNVQKVNRSVWEVDMGVIKKNLWVHYNAEFGFFSGSLSVEGRFSEDKALLQVFLGPEEDEYAVIPNSEFVSDEFYTYNDDENKMWRFNVSHESNAEKLAQYRSLEPITE